MRQVGDEEQVALDGSLTSPSSMPMSSMRCDSAAIVALERLGLVAAAGPHQLAELLVPGIALRTQLVHLRLEGATACVGFEHAVDGVGRLALAGDRRASPPRGPRG